MTLYKQEEGLKLKKGLTTTMIVLLIAALVGCGSSKTASTDEAQGDTAKQAGDIKIGIASQSMKEQVYRDMKAGAEAKAKELGVQVEWQSCDLNAEKEMEIVNNYITQEFDVIAIEPVNPETSTPMMEAAAAAGIPVVDLEAVLMGGDGPAVRVTCDFNAIGKANAQRFLDDWGADKPANIVILNGTKTDNVAQEINKGYHEVLDKNPQIKIVQEEWHNNWDRQLAMTTMQNVLARGDKVDAVISNNDGMCMGAVRAAEEAGVKDQILFYSMDHDKDAVQEMISGTKYTDIDKSSNLQGQRLVEAAYALATGQDVQYDKEVDGIKTWYTPYRFTSWQDMTVSKEVYPDLFK
jgi:ABC-type sugar transport system substrate-binding protein